MNYHIIKEKKIKNQLDKLKKNKVQDPGKLKPELYKILSKSEVCLKTLSV